MNSVIDCNRVVLLARTLTRPIRELTTATRAIVSGDLYQKIPVHSQDELGELAMSFNCISDELIRAQDMRRHMMADVAQEKRTLMSMILGSLDGKASAKY
jgi:two-component system sensor histidine kinase BaeS